MAYQAFDDVRCTIADATLMPAAAAAENDHVRHQLPGSHLVSHHREFLARRDIMPPLIMPSSLHNTSHGSSFHSPTSSPASTPPSTERPMSQTRGHRRSNAISIPLRSTFLIPQRPAPPIPQGRKPASNLDVQRPSPTSMPCPPVPSPTRFTRPSFSRSSSSAGSVRSCSSTSSSSSLVYDEVITDLYTSFPKKRDFDAMNAGHDIDIGNGDNSAVEEEDEAMDLDFWRFLQHPLMVTRKG